MLKMNPDNFKDSDYPSTCTCWDDMTSQRLDSHSCNTLGLSDGTGSLESGMGEGEYEYDLFEAGLEEVGDLRGGSEEVLESFSEKLMISPTSSTEVCNLVIQ